MTSGSNIKQRMRDLLVELAGLDGVSGHEQPVVTRLKELMEPLADQFMIDTYGNIVATLRGPDESQTLMVSAHSDEIGAIVKSIDPNGMIRFEKNGGVIDSLALGRFVRVRGHRGIIGVKAGHIQTPAERSSVPGARELYVDLGFETAEQVAALDIQVGDPISFDAPVVPLANPDRLAGKAVDNRISCAMLVMLLEQLKDVQLDVTLHVVVAVQEEVGLRGARMVTHRLNPDAAIVVDTMPAGGTPDVDSYRDLSMHSGRGPVITLESRGGSSGHFTNPGMRDYLRRIAQQSGILVQEGVFHGGTSDVSAVHLERGGIPSAAINLARRYSHSPVEMVDINDAVGGLALLKTSVEQFGSVGSLEFLKSRW